MTSHLALAFLSIKSNVSSPPSSPKALLTNTKKEERDIPMDTIPEAPASMLFDQELGDAGRIVKDGEVEGVEFEQFNGAVKFNLKKEVLVMKAADAHQKRLRAKYPEIDDTPIYLLEEIERLQMQYAQNGSDECLAVSSECGGKLCLSKHGPWLNLTRKSFPRRKKGAKQAVSEYMVVPLAKDAPFGNWMPFNEDANPEITLVKKPAVIKKKVMFPASDSSDEDMVKEVETAKAPLDPILAAFAKQLNGPGKLVTPPLSNADSGSELSILPSPSMNSEEFEESHNSSTNSHQQTTPSHTTQPMAAQQDGVYHSGSQPEPSHYFGGEYPSGYMAGQISENNSSHLMSVPDTPDGSPRKRRKTSPSKRYSTSSPIRESSVGPSSKTGSKRRKVCIHSGHESSPE